MCSRRRKAPSVPASLQRSASASNRRFSLPENWRRLAIATTSGSRRAPSPEAISPVALPAPSATASEEEPDNPFREDFSNEVMFMSYLYSKLPETGVSPQIGTGGTELSQIVFSRAFPKGNPGRNCDSCPDNPSQQNERSDACSRYRCSRHEVIRSAVSGQGEANQGLGNRMRRRT